MVPREPGSRSGNAAMPNFSPFLPLERNSLRVTPLGVWGVSSATRPLAVRTRSTVRLDRIGLKKRQDVPIIPLDIVNAKVCFVSRLCLETTSFLKNSKMFVRPRPAPYLFLRSRTRRCAEHRGMLALAHNGRTVRLCVLRLGQECDRRSVCRREHVDEHV